MSNLRLRSPLFTFPQAVAVQIGDSCRLGAASHLHSTFLGGIEPRRNDLCLGSRNLRGIALSGPTPTPHHSQSQQTKQGRLWDGLHTHVVEEHIALVTA